MINEFVSFIFGAIFGGVISILLLEIAFEWRELKSEEVELRAEITD